MSTKNVIKPIKIINIEHSNAENKRFRVHLNNGETYNFGLEGASTYIDHRDKKTRANYRARHYATEQDFIDNLEPSPALFSYMLLWGPSTSLDKNVKSLNKLFKIHNIQ
jgi:hypothetical protein